MSTAIDDADLATHIDRLKRLPELHRELRACTTVAQLFARASELACTECTFARAVILSIDHGRLTAHTTGVLSDRASDTLRRRVLAAPIPLSPGTPESVAIRSAEVAGSERAAAPSVLAQALALDHHALGVIAPDRRPLALLVLDRPDPPVHALDEAMVMGFAAMLALALEHTVLRARIAELSTELRYMAASAQAMMAEVREAPVSLPGDWGHRMAFSRVDGLDAALPARDRVAELLSDREQRIAALLVEGRSNREIADELILSPETVKAHVARILRKLQASNRVEAVTRYLRLTQEA